VIAGRSVSVDVAARRGLLVRMRGPVLADLMEELVAAVLHSAPASALLLTASAHGDRIYISLTDDVPGADPFVRQAMLRGVMERVALRGGAIDVRVRPDEGTTVTLRVMAVFQNPSEEASLRDDPAPAPESAGVR
jgi:glucose-6-phosphate-specific signal transduction histidine kinase